MMKNKTEHIKKGEKMEKELAKEVNPVDREKLDIVAENGDSVIVRTKGRKGYILMSDGKKSPEMVVDAFLKFGYWNFVPPYDKPNPEFEKMMEEEEKQIRKKELRKD